MNDLKKSFLIAVGAGIVGASAVGGAIFVTLKTTGNEDAILDIRHKWMRSISSTENIFRETQKHIKSVLKNDEEEVIPKNE